MLIDVDSKTRLANSEIQSEGGGAAHNHGINTANHLPPYYALAFIIYVGV